MNPASPIRSLLAGAALPLAATLFALPGTAQEPMSPVPIPGRVKNAGVYHVATGEWTRGSQTYGLLGQDVLYRNDRATGYFGLLDENEIMNDEGRLPGKDHLLRQGYPETGTADVYRITGFSFGYCALTPAPLTASWTFREAYDPCSNPESYPVTASVVTTGLPNDGCWIVALDLTGTTAEFEMAADGADGSWDNDYKLDDLGIALNLDGGQGDGVGQLSHGPLVGGRSDLPLTEGDGTIFKNPTLEGTGLGTDDWFWLTSPVVFDGCYFYNGCTPCATLRVTLFGEGSDVTSLCSPASSNSVSAAGATLTTLGGFGTAAASFIVTDIPDQPGLVYAGPEQADMPFGCGRRCVGGSVARYDVLFPVGNTVTTVIDMTVLPGLDHVQYWYRDPVHAGVCGASFNLSNALGL